MTEKDLVCLMAALLWPHVNANDNKDEQLAVSIARTIVSEVNSQFAQRMLNQRAPG